MIDVDGADEVIRDLTKAGLTAGIKATTVLDQSGRHGRDMARRLAPKTGLPHYTAKITHEVRVTPDAVEVEWGPERGGQGSLGHILEHGTSRTPPHAHLGPSLDLEAPDAVKSLGRILGEL